MARVFNDLIKDWPAARRARVAARAKALIEEEITLRDLRKARALTQVKMAKTLGIGQAHVSRLEKKSDMLLSTLASYVRAMGGELRLSAEFPGRRPVRLTALADVFADQGEGTKTRRKRKKAPARKAA